MAKIESTPTLNATRHQQGYSREPLEALLKAPNKKSVDELFVREFSNRRRQAASEDSIEAAVDSLKVSEDEAKELVLAVRGIIRDALFDNCVEQRVLDLFPEDFHGSLKKLIALIITKRMPDWRQQVIKQQISLPELQRVDWRVDVKSASDQMSQMSVPTILVELQVEDAQNEKTPHQRIHFELEREALSTVLEGFSKIRDQLSSLRPQE